MKVYISGPMTGYPEHNYPAFFAAEETLAALGHEVINPARNPEQASWADYMRVDLAQLLTADGVALLPDWSASIGARLEAHVAGVIGMHLRPLARWGAAR